MVSKQIFAKNMVSKQIFVINLLSYFTVYTIEIVYATFELGNPVFSRIFHSDKSPTKNRMS